MDPNHNHSAMQTTPNVVDTTEHVHIHPTTMHIHPTTMHIHNHGTTTMDHSGHGGDGGDMMNHNMLVI